MELMKLLEDHRTGQDSTQLGSFVLGGRTPWGVYKQSLQELYKRVRGLRQMTTDRDLLLLDIEELEEDSEKGGRKGRRAAINLRSKKGSLEEADRAIRDTKREAALFYKVAVELKDKFGEVSEEQRQKLDFEEWKWWHIKRAAIAWSVSKRVDDVVLKNLTSIPIDAREDWLNVLGDSDKLNSALKESEYGRVETTPTEKEIRLIEDMSNDCNN